MHVGSLSFKVCLFLGVNPDEQLTCKDIAKRWHSGPPKCIRQSMQTALASGYVINATGKPGRGRLVRYAAGPRLLAERAQGQA